MEKKLKPRKGFETAIMMNTAEEPLKGGRFGNPPMRIIILNEIEGNKFDDCYANARNINLGEVDFCFMDYDGLIKNNKSAGRLKDLADIEALEKIQKRKNQ